MIAKDFKKDAKGDISIENGDFVVTDSDREHILDIMQSMPGWFKKFPLVGFNPYQYLNANVSSIEVSKNAKIQLQSDGYDNIVSDLKIDSNGTVIGSIDGKRL
jgi:hypothetical protein